ncbi:hypothetical protein AWZ03_000476 [Drosophila navojoa]|uniref:Uncharacterized protein n=1 Tax=Drosophila navojoa TaxID=7232 RepID=A0A484BW52_DRONA|nr:hypothetical protein AWZ03_000476 [Drosophila navojoa]
MCRIFTQRCLKIATITSLCILLQFSIAEVGVNITYILNQTCFRVFMIVSSAATVIFMIIISTIGMIVLFGQNRLRPFILAICLLVYLTVKSILWILSQDRERKTIMSKLSDIFFTLSTICTVSESMRKRIISILLVTSLVWKIEHS